VLPIIHKVSHVPRLLVTSALLRVQVFKKWSFSHICVK
jgi:hypothetical protein